MIEFFFMNTYTEESFEVISTVHHEAFTIIHFIFAFSADVNESKSVFLRMKYDETLIWDIQLWPNINLYTRSGS